MASAFGGAIVGYIDITGLLVDIKTLRSEAGKFDISVGDA